MHARALALILLALAAAGCGAAASQSPQRVAAARSVLEFSNGYVSLRYPATWRALRFHEQQELHSMPMLYLSTQPARDPCRTTPTRTSCGWPVDRLQPEGVLVIFENRGYPGWTLRSLRGAELRVGGRAARRIVSRPGICRPIGADETVVIAVARPMAFNWTQITACLRGPRLAEGEQQLDRLLASTKFLAP